MLKQQEGATAFRGLQALPAASEPSSHWCDLFYLLLSQKGLKRLPAPSPAQDRAHPCLARDSTTEKGQALPG